MDRIIFVTMLQPLEVSRSQRLDYIKLVIEEEDIRFPGAQFERETKQDSGNIAKMLSGKKPVTDSFFAAFLEKHPKVPKKWVEYRAMPSGGAVRTLKDYIERIENHEAFLQKMLETSLVDISTNLAELLKRKVGDQSISDQTSKIVDPDEKVPETSNKKGKERSLNDKQGNGND